VRAFLAVAIHQGLRDTLAALSGRLRQSTANVSWVKPENVHITLRFLGDVDESRVDRLSELLAVAYRTIPAFPLTVAGVGGFPSARQPRVVWTGVSPRDGAIQQLYRHAEDAARGIGLEAEKRRYTPHITLGRLRDPKEAGDLPVLIAREMEFAAGDIHVSRVALFRSKLSPKGATYTVIREFPLQWIS
jgi:RNA 2',3'-cyclic 3'-phosphodiesterase